jgi:hypothetical protein
MEKSLINCKKFQNFSQIAEKPKKMFQQILAQIKLANNFKKIQSSLKE